MKKYALSLLMIFGLCNVAVADDGLLDVDKGDPRTGLAFPILIEKDHDILNTYYCVSGNVYVTETISNINVLLGIPIMVKGQNVTCENFEEYIKGLKKTK